jgi:hypothetical protein
MDKSINSKTMPKSLVASVSKSVISSKDFRIGNYYLDEDNNWTEMSGYNLWQLSVKENHKSYLQIAKEYKPLIANTENLSKIGFELFYDGSYYRYQISELETIIYLRPSLDKWYFGFVNGEKECEINDCYELEFIHEVQNLIFSLTKVSLTVC